jgi:hypothetical protein
VFVSSAPARPIRADLGTRRAVLGRRFAARAGQLPPDGGLWIAWPKKVSRIENDLSDYRSSVKPAASQASTIILLAS